MDTDFYRRQRKLRKLLGIVLRINTDLEALHSQKWFSQRETIQSSLPTVLGCFDIRIIHPFLRIALTAENAGRQPEIRRPKTEQGDF